MVTVLNNYKEVLISAHIKSTIIFYKKKTRTKSKKFKF